MTAAAKPAAGETKWSKLRAQFKLDEIELLPKFTGKKVEIGGKWVPPKDSYKTCPECGGYHPFPCIHLSYVGHAGITNRLLDVDPEWNWEPLSLTPTGTPLMSDGGMWIRLTVLGVTRLGFGDAQGKTGPNATKEIIGDALRNAAMRFGVGTYLWSKSDAAKAELTRQGVDDEPAATPAAAPAPERPAAPEPPAAPSRVVASKDTLQKLSNVRAKFGTSDEVFGQQIDKVSRHNATCDIELSEAEAVVLIARYEDVLAEAQTAQAAAAEMDQHFADEISGEDIPF